MSVGHEPGLSPELWAYLPPETQGGARGGLLLHLHPPGYQGGARGGLLLHPAGHQGGAGGRRTHSTISHRNVPPRLRGYPGPTSAREGEGLLEANTQHLLLPAHRAPLLHLLHHWELGLVLVAERK